MTKAHSVCKGWDFVSRGTELSVGKFLSEYFTPLTTSEEQQIGIVSDEDTDDVWVAAREEAICKVRKNEGRVTGTTASIPDEKEVERTFWLSRSDGWLINRKMKRIIIHKFEFLSSTSPASFP